MAVAWRIGWLTVMRLFSPKDLYYLFAHPLTPLVMGIALLTSRP